MKLLKRSGHPVLAGAIFFVLVTYLFIAAGGALIRSNLGPWPITYPTADEFMRTQKVLQIFTRGMEDPEVCPSQEPGYQVFCYEGTYYAEHLKRLQQRQFQTDANFLDDHAPRISGVDPALARSIWLTSLGLALGQLDLDARLVFNQFRDRNLFPHVVDGWAFQTFLRHGYVNTNYVCQKAYSEDVLQGCEFGMGRAAFFHRYGIRGVANPAAALMIGYNFAKAFTMGEPSLEDSSNLPPAAINAALLKLYWMGRLPADTANLQASECYKRRDFVACLAEPPLAGQSSRVSRR